jgi:membrane-bound serine protease (ClpP class)
MEAIASRRSRNVEWAKSAVRESASITAEKAQELKVVEIIAPDLNNLLTQLNGRTVNGKQLRTVDAQLVEIKMSAAEQFFQVFWRPEVMFVLMLVAIYGLIGEMTTPGAILPGVTGAIALVLALYMAAILPVNLAGLLLIGLAVALFVIDLFAPTHGVLTGGGLVAFLVGSLMLFDRRDPLFRLSLSYILPSVLVTAGFFLLIVGKGLRAQRLPVQVGRETMLGKAARALTPINSAGGRVFVEGESWTARSSQPINEGDPVQIIGVEGLTVKVISKP